MLKPSTNPQQQQRQPLPPPTSTVPPSHHTPTSTATNSERLTPPKTFASIGTQTLHSIEAIKQNPTIVSTDNNPTSLEKLSTDNGHTNKNGLNGHKGGINGGDTLKLSASVAYPTTIVNMGGSTETSAEVEDPVPALSVFSTQGLPEDPSKVNIKREYFITTEGVAVVPPAAVFSGYGSGDYPNTELIYSQTAGQGQASYNAGLQPQTSGELDPDTAGSDNIYHIILTTDGPRLSSTTENYLALKGVSTTEEADSKSTTESASQQQHLMMRSAYHWKAIQPIHLCLKHDFSLRDNNFQINDSDDIGDEPRSIGGGHHGIVSSFETFKATKHLEDPSYGSGGGSGSGSGSVLIAEELPSSTTEGSGDLQSSTESYEKLKPAEVVQFMYSGEDSSEETRITNSTDFKLMMDDGSAAVQGMKIMDTSLESSETQQQQQMEFEMGSGSGEIKLAKQQQQPKEREPTTARPNKHTTALDIDEVHDASGSGPQDDPKLDVESLKVEENANDSPLNTEKSSKNNVLSVKVQPSQEKQLHDDLH
ncbi:hypothetical protein DOY81_014641 [Sarcophaga bullata]|nr:hypothetical protein DOY81_014641 [Sarcophaga bullata]